MTSKKRIAVIGGDGIGKEVSREAVRILEVLAERFPVDFEIDDLPYGSDHYLETGIALPRDLRLQLGRDYDAILLGAVGDPRIEDNITGREIVLGLRVDLDLYMNVRPVNLVDERVSPLKGKPSKTSSSRLSAKIPRAATVVWAGNNTRAPIMKSRRQR